MFDILGRFWLAILPSIVIGILIFKLDKIEREPKGQLFLALLMGVLSIIITLIISYFIGVFEVENLNEIKEILIYSFLQIALVEEFSKWLCTYIFIQKNKNFNYLFDGIVYAVFVSLGFATIENLLYTMQYGMLTGLIRAITTVPGHAIFGIALGYYLSLSKLNYHQKNYSKAGQNIFYSLIFPVILHGFFDFCLLSGIPILLLVFFLFALFLYAYGYNRIRKMQAREEPFLDKKISYCKNCGNKVNSKFCSHCGLKVEE